MGLLMSPGVCYGAKRTSAEQLCAWRTPMHFDSAHYLIPFAISSFVNEMLRNFHQKLFLSISLQFHRELRNILSIFLIVFKQSFICVQGPSFNVCWKVKSQNDPPHTLDIDFGPIFDNLKVSEEKNSQKNIFHISTLQGLFLARFH